ncbi:MAG TPA: hypothetical protein VFH95_01645 [Candidatus Kapabacteria bacterium]|nr:hypothetical protein [Candidatus Kapabacteria bacterium]
MDNPNHQQEAGARTHATGQFVFLSTLNANASYTAIVNPGAAPQTIPVNLVNTFGCSSTITPAPVAGVQLWNTASPPTMLAQYPDPANPGNVIGASHNWQVAQMVDGASKPSGYWVAWNPTTDAIVIMDQNISTQNLLPSPKKP